MKKRSNLSKYAENALHTRASRIPMRVIPEVNKTKYKSYDEFCYFVRRKNIQVSKRQAKVPPRSTEHFCSTPTPSAQPKA